MPSQQRCRRPSVLSIAALILASAATPSVSRPDDPKQSPLIQHEEVRFVSLDLVVEDHRSGKWQRTTDLRREQIKVLVGGKEIELDTFESYCPGSTVTEARNKMGARPPDARGAASLETEDATSPGSTGPEVHRYILYFDLENLTLSARANAFRAAAEWADSSVRPEDEVMMVTGGLSLRVVRPLLPASRHLKEDIQSASQDFSGVDMWADGERNRLDEIRTASTYREKELLANAYAAIDYDYARRGLEYARTVMAMYDSVPGIKNLIFFSETLREVPGSIYLPAPRLPMSAPMQPDSRVLPDVTAPMQALARDASDKNVRIYAVQAGGLGKDVEDTMTFLSTETGGNHLEGTNRLAAVFDQTRADLDCFYRIGFRLPTRQSGQTERITVSLREGEGKYRLRYRRTLDDPSREQRDEATIRAAFLRPSAAKGFPIGAEVTRLKQEELGTRFRIQVLVPLEGLTALPGPDPAHRDVRLEIGGLIVPLIAPAGKSGVMEDSDVWTDVAVTRKSLKFSRQATLQIPVASQGKPRRRAGLYTREFLAPPGHYRLVFVANDMNGHTVSATVSEFESSPPASRLAGATLGFEGRDLIPLPAEGPKPEAKKEKPWKGKDLEDAAPEIGAGLLLAARPGIGIERSLWAVYEVCSPDAQATAPSKHVAPSSSGAWKMDRILDCMGKSLHLPALPLTPPVGETPCIVVHEKIPSSDLPQGTCRLSVILSQDGKVEPARELEFTVLPRSPEPPSTTTP